MHLWRRIVTIFAIAVLVNYPWELLQAPFYNEGGNPRDIWWHCFVASLGDGVLVLLIFVAGWAAQRCGTGSVRPGAPGYLLMLTVGFAIAVSVEWLALQFGRWSYTTRMPQVFGIGVFPVLQMLMLPLLIFGVAARWLDGK